jgi:hypothetical protein
MSRTLQFKRYANTVVANTTGAAGEIIIETTNNIVTVHTGGIAGGVRMASESYVATLSNSILTYTNNVNNSQNNSINIASNTAQSSFDKANITAQSVPQNAQTTNYTITSSDAGKYLYYTQNTSVNLYIPSNSNTSFPNGTTIMIVSRTTSGANVTVTPSNGILLFLTGNTTSSSRNVVSYGMATIIQVESNTWMISGSGVV